MISISYLEFVAKVHPAAMPGFVWALIDGAVCKRIPTF
jgi:hypothetical protein